MVTKWGLSDKLGPLSYSEDDGEVFLGRQVTQHKQVSDETAHVIDEEIRLLIETNYDVATQILEEHRPILDAMAQALMKFETIDQKQIADVMAGKPPRPPEDWGNSGASGTGDTDDSASADDKAAGVGGPAELH